MSMLAHVRPASPLPRRCGIYGIVHLPSGRCYVGSALNLRARHQGHDWRLRWNIHPNQHLQNAWNKYGSAAFEFRILDYVDDPADLIAAEQAWIDALAPAFNLRKRARSNLGLRFEHSRPRAKETRPRAPKTLTPEHRAHIGAALKGYKHSERRNERIRATRNQPERRALYSQSVRRMWAERLTPQALAAKAGIEGEVVSIKQAAAQIGCSAGSIRRFIHGGLLVATAVGKFWVIRQVDLDATRPAILAQLQRRKWPPEPRPVRPLAPTPRGEAHAQAKLSADDVRAMRVAYATKTASMYDLARRYGVGAPTVWRIIHRLGWKHVE